METLFYVRHGLSEANLAGRFAGSMETPLAPEGIAQARAAGREVRDLWIDLIVSSPQLRALQTARIVAEASGYPTCGILVNRLLRERHFGTLEGTPWQPGLDLAVMGVEDVTALRLRAKAAEEWLRTLTARRVLVVGHGSFGSALQCRFAPNMTFDDRAAGGVVGVQPSNGEVVQWWPPTQLGS